MADEIIDLTRYLRREPAAELPRGSMTLWGAEGERSRFALPLWRIIHLAHGERGLILRAPLRDRAKVDAYLVLDLGAEPARTSIEAGRVPRFGPEEGPSLVDIGSDGLAVFLGAREGFVWTLWVDGIAGRETPLSAAAREDLLFLAGECAGLLFLRDFDAEPPPVDSATSEDDAADPP